MSEVENSILNLLGNQTEPVTYSYINAVLPKWSFEEISKSLDELRQRDLVHVGIEGVSLKHATPLDSLTPALPNHAAETEAHSDSRDLEWDILIGEDSSKAPEQYAQMSERELRDLVATLENRPSLLEYSDEPTIGTEPVSSYGCTQSLDILPDCQKEYAPIHMHDSPDSLDLSNRVKKALKKCGIHTIEKLISNLDVFFCTRGLGERSKWEVTELLKNGARIDLSVQTSEQIEAMHCLSKSAEYYFDAFGTLSVAKESGHKINSLPRHSTLHDLDEECLLLPIDVLNMGDAINRCFKRNGVRLIADLVLSSDEQLLKLHGIGMKKVSAARGALGSYFSLETGLTNAVAAESEISPTAYEDYLSEYSDRTVEVLDKCIMNLVADNIDVNPNAFMVSYLPLAQETIETSDGSLEAAVEVVLETISKSPSASAVFKSSLIAQLQRARSNELTERIEHPVAAPINPIWHDLLLEVISETDNCFFDEQTGCIKFKHPKLQEWIDGLPEREAKLVNLRLQGLTLDECGKQVEGITRERVRQILEKVLSQRPLLFEDSFRFIYMAYDINEAQFSIITGLDSKVANYIKQTSRQNERENRPLSKALSDDSVRDKTKDRIRAYLNNDFVFVDGERIHKDRKSILNYLIAKLTERSNATMHDLLDAYERFLNEHSLATKDLLFTTFHNFQEWTKRNIPEILSVKNGEKAFIRYYDASQHDFVKLQEFMMSGLFENIECSAALLFNHPQATELMQELDIRNEYELHFLARNYCSLPPSVVFGRMPTIVFGTGDRRRQVLEMIQEEGPIDAFTLSELYKEKYGVSKESFRGSYLNGFEAYKNHGVYSCSFEEMTADQLDSLASILTKDYQPMHLVKLQFKDRHPDVPDSFINKLNLERIGFRPSHGLIIRQELNESQVFQTLIDENSTFGVDTKGFFSEVLRHPAFERILKTNLNALKVVEYEKNKYIHLQKVIDALGGNASIQDFKDYVEQVVSFTEKGVPFTVFSLKRDGFSHPVEELIEEVGLGEKFLESLILTARVGGRVKSTSANDHDIFCKTSYRFSIVDLFEYVLTNKEKMNIDDLCALLYESYGIEFNEPHARSIIKRSDLYFDDALDMAFASPREYNEMVEQILSNITER